MTLPNLKNLAWVGNVGKKVFVPNLVWELREHKSTLTSCEYDFYEEPVSPNRLVTDSILGSRQGSGYTFQVFNTTDLIGKDLKVTWQGIRSGSGTVRSRFEVYDGSYDRTSLVDFPNFATKLIKGVGLIDQVEIDNNFGELTSTITAPDYSGTGSECTIFVENSDTVNGAGLRLLIKTIEIVGLATWTFDSNQTTSFTATTANQNEHGTTTVTAV